MKRIKLLIILGVLVMALFGALVLMELWKLLILR